MLVERPQDQDLGGERTDPPRGQVDDADHQPPFEPLAWIVRESSHVDAGDDTIELDDEEALSAAGAIALAPPWDCGCAAADERCPLGIESTGA
jgi:hypothetical protein